MNGEKLSKIHRPTRATMEKDVQSFKVDHLSRFCTGAHQVFTTQKPLLSEIPITMKTAKSNIL